ncbi:IS21 family transposase [Turicibacter sanguinis]|nr:IS21 family transposase [Turicibacter sanguinis]
MLTLEKKEKMIRLYLTGLSYTEIAKEIGMTRQTVSKYIKQYETDLKELESATTTQEKEQIIIRSSAKPKYDISNRQRFKLTPDVEEMNNTCLLENKQKIQQGKRKLIMKNIDIYEWLISNQIDISYQSVCAYIAKQTQRSKEAFIRQAYEPGQVAEFDWGDVTLYIDELGADRRFKIGVFNLKYSDKQFAYLYSHENTEAFLDIHTRFFEEIQGVPTEVVYDNARVQVTYLAGREKQPTEAVKKLTNYYGYAAHYTNPYSGHEKGHVERSVELIRRKAYSKCHRFKTIADAVTALLDATTRENQKVKQQTNQSADAVFAQEQKHLLPYRVPLDTYLTSTYKVNKYSLIHVDSNFYSVPDYLVGKEVTVRKNIQQIKVYYQDRFLFKAKRLIGCHQYHIDIHHYLATLKKKPGAIAHSLALKQATPWLQNIFQTYYNTNPRDFIYLLTIIEQNSLETIQFAIEWLQRQGLPIQNNQIVNYLVNLNSKPSGSKDLLEAPIEQACYHQLSEISSIYSQGENSWIN